MTSPLTTEAPRQCVVLVGGMGTRLGPLTANVPKPLLPVGGRPFIDFLLDECHRFGFSEALLLAGHHGAQVAEHAAAYRAARPGGMTVEVVVEPEPLGTGGALRWALGDLDDRFLLLNGDSWFDFNWLDLHVLAAGAPDAAMAMALRHIDDASRFGAAILEGGRVTGFRERGDASGGSINGGVYLVTRDLVAALPVKSSFERDAIPPAAARGELVGRIYDGAFIDIGVPESYAAAERELPRWRRRPALFLDRDGTLNHDHGYVHRIDQFDWIDGAIGLIKAANDAGLYVFIVTNQAGVAHGYYGEVDIAVLHAHMQGALRAEGAHIDDFRYCLMHPQAEVERYRGASSWRKPGPGMLLDLKEHWDIDMARSWMIGNAATDMEAAAGAGVGGLLYDGTIDLLTLAKPVFG